MCLTNHKLQNIPLVSCCLHLWSCLDCFFVNTCTFPAYLLHLLLKKKQITYLINRDGCKNKMKIQTYFWKKFIMKSHVTTCHYSLFFVQNSWVVTTHDSQGKKYFCHWNSFDHVLSIKTFTDKRTCCLWLCVCVTGLDNKWCPASCSTYFSNNLGQRAFVE